MPVAKLARSATATPVGSMPEFQTYKVTSKRYHLQIDCTLNSSATVGCHWVDPATGRYLKESPWQEATPSTTFEVEVPEAPGKYGVQVG